MASETEIAYFLRFIEHCSLCGFSMDISQAVITESCDIICKDCQKMIEDAQLASASETRKSEAPPADI
jgi:hypothetical protein